MRESLEKTGYELPPGFYSRYTKWQSDRRRMFGDDPDGPQDKTEQELTQQLAALSEPERIEYYALIEAGVNVALITQMDKAAQITRIATDVNQRLSEGKSPM